MKINALILAKSESKRLPHKNNLDFHGLPMFLVNVQKALQVFDEVYVSSDSKSMLREAEKMGAIGIERSVSLCGDVPNIPVYQDALDKMEKDVKAIVAIQSCSPNVPIKLMFTVKGLMEFGYGEVMTCHPLQHDKNYHEQSAKIYGSLWGISVKKLKDYADPYKPTPDILVVDTSEDIHYEDDYQIALKNHVA